MVPCVSVPVESPAPAPGGAGLFFLGGGSEAKSEAESAGRERGKALTASPTSLLGEQGFPASASAYPDPTPTMSRCWDRDRGHSTRQHLCKAHAALGRLSARRGWQSPTGRRGWHGRWRELDRPPLPVCRPSSRRRLSCPTNPPPHQDLIEISHVCARRHQRLSRSLAVAAPTRPFPWGYPPPRSFRNIHSPARQPARQPARPPAHAAGCSQVRGGDHPSPAPHRRHKTCA